MGGGLCAVGRQWVSTCSSGSTGMGTKGVHGRGHGCMCLLAAPPAGMPSSAAGPGSAGMSQTSWAWVWAVLGGGGSDWSLAAVRNFFFGSLWGILSVPCRLVPAVPRPRVRVLSFAGCPWVVSALCGDAVVSHVARLRPGAVWVLLGDTLRPCTM